MADEDGPTHDEILAAFRSKRAQRAAAPSQGDKELAAAVAPAPPPALVQAPPAPASTQPPSSPPPSAVDPTPPPPAASEPRQSPLVVAPPRSTALEPAFSAGRSLAAVGPVLRLSERLLQDAHLAVRGSRIGRRVGLAILLVGLAALALERRAGLAANADYVVVVGATELSALLVCVGIAVLGALLLTLFTFVPGTRRLAVRLAPSQKEEWERVQGEARALRVLGILATAALVAGFASAALAYSAVGYGPARFGLLALAAILLVVGIVQGSWAASRRAAVQRLYVQTMVLARLEGSGLGPGGGADPRVAPVLKALDQLLGALPESAVRQFLASQQAQDYLDLVEESNEDRHG